MSNKRRRSSTAMCYHHAASNQPLELLTELQSELHRPDGIHVRFRHAVICPVVAFRVSTQLTALVESVLDIRFHVPVVQAGARRQIDGRERGSIANEQGRALETVGR